MGEELEAAFRHYLSQLHGGESEHALHSLMDMGPAVIPLLAQAFEAESDPDVRENLIHVAWQQRSADALSLLGTALQDEAPHVWKEAIDGLVALGSTEAQAKLLDARHIRPERPTAGKLTFTEWIEDAIDQIVQKPL